MDLIHYSFTPLILFCVPYTLDLLPYYLSIQNGAGGEVGHNGQVMNADIMLLKSIKEFCCTPYSNTHSSGVDYSIRSGYSYGPVPTEFWLFVQHMIM